MTPARLTLIATVFAAAILATADAAPAPPVVDAQVVQKTGTFPVDIAGQRPRARKGAKLGDGQILISRRVSMSHGQRVRIALECPSGAAQRGLGIATDSTIAFTVADVKHYIGVRRVVIIATARVSDGDTGSGRVYGLCS
jgi:hypothetical protein